MSVVLALVATGCSKSAGGGGGAGTWSDKAAAGKDLWAVMRTSEGDITIKLWSTVAAQSKSVF